MTGESTVGSKTQGFESPALFSFSLISFFRSYVGGIALVLPTPDTCLPPAPYSLLPPRLHLKRVRCIRGTLVLWLSYDGRTHRKERDLCATRVNGKHAPCRWRVVP